MINSWKGPHKGYGLVPAEQWLPYQALNGTDSFNGQVTIPKGTSFLDRASTARALRGPGRSGVQGPTGRG
jgi:hypothetical protein